LVIGSFLNVVILRLPRIMERDWRLECAELADAADGHRRRTNTSRAGGLAIEASQPLSLSHPGSSCPDCGHRIRPWENIPVLSFLLLRGRCSNCAAPSPGAIR
jgi:leader peptidase (prepilin peptidase)/N-methyltransferase